MTALMSLPALYDPKKECVVFVDCPDPDNFVLAVCAQLLRGTRHVVLTGRPANFDVS